MGFDIESIREYMQHGDFDGFQSIANTLIYARETGLEFGRNLISVVLFFIPRSMWNKAEPLGSAAAEHMGYAYTNISAPIYGELYIDFGIFSLVTGMAIIGFGVRLFDAYYTHMIKIKQYGTGLLLTAAMSGYLIILLRGSLLAVISSIATLFGLLIFASWLGTHSIPGRLREYRPHHHL
jgi:hypothetical protein